MKKIVPESAVLIPDVAERVFQGEIFAVYQWQQELFDGKQTTFEMLRRPDTVTAIGIVDDQIIVLEDDQPHHGMRLSFPGGRVDEDDTSILSAAKREMKEETGYKFDNWRLVRVWQPHAKLEWFIYCYVAWGASHRTDQHLDGGEKIEVKIHPFEEVRKLALENKGHLGGCRDVFEHASSIVDLTGMPEYKGIEVDR